jgi:ribosomal protein S18 acetylase RimI-like enzyme
MEFPHKGYKFNACAEFPLRDLSSCDFHKLKQSHTILPIDYENDFFIKVCGKEDLHFGLCAEIRSDDGTLAGFATARQVGIYALCYNDKRALGKSGIPVDEESELVYVLTIGVAPAYRRRGLARALMQGIVRV